MFYQPLPGCMPAGQQAFYFLRQQLIKKNGQFNQMRN